ncbi:carcinoembryonic antigen-related cell adhesion molecule 1 isoform X5 [Mesocricetus auratus]|uniref:Carcinoembryonic antigen-related cell adhesion molecule 1 isoform X5 n=1 Tax=Mesocricetus auratus TaxID=10036 RepID=A0ABM2WNK4_MESAU|nr:carcinoembryonic antigen-related cell adhesion molecule 1 isoform X5 [Mesocricetus auratus]
MELTSAPLHKGQVPWRGLLLAALLLAYWNSPVSAQVTVEAVPTHVAEGANVLLQVHNLPTTLQVFYWYKGDTLADSNEIARFIISSSTNSTGPAHTGRETIYQNGSLLFQNVMQNDTGTYTFHMLTANFDNPTKSLQFYVHEPVTPPSIQVANTTFKELESVSLTCDSQDIGISIRWLFNGQSLGLTDRMKLSENNSTLSIDPVRREDSGKYECEVSNPVSSERSNPIQLNIIPDPTQGSSGLSAGAIAGIVVGCVAGVALIAALAYFLYFRKTGRGTDQRELTEHKPSASNHNLGPSDSSPNKVNEVTYSVLDFSAQRPRPPDSASPSPRAIEAVYSEVKKK